ncbi:hypothetical protein CAN33_0038830 [Aspergillus niger]|uniref:EKC/KEOPS complex subunit BUD32 n=1 Tax=Aspergillus niger TaxID=5061 RepID=A0A505HNY3_ASPNG|nr:hypothetical protein CAN33_0038830 [Aspergillus niger]
MEEARGSARVSTMENEPSQPLGYPKAISYIIMAPGLEDLAFVPNFGEIAYHAKGTYLSMGGTAILERLPSGNVAKTPLSNPYSQRLNERHRQSMRVEAHVYECLNGHPRIPKLIDWDPVACCLTLEYFENGSLGDFVGRNDQSIDDCMRSKWARQAAEGIQLLHHHNVIHSDISPNNFLLDSNLDLKISDFAGSSVCGSPGSALPGISYRDPSIEFYVLRCSDDIFSLGSVIYFIMTGKHPC